MNKRIIVISAIVVVIIAGLIFFLRPSVEEPVVIKAEQTQLLASPEEVQIVRKFISDFKEKFNSGEIPAEVRNVIANENIAISVEGFGDAYVITRDGKITDVDLGSLQNPSLKLSTDRQIVEDLANNEITIENALSENKVDFEGVGFANTVKVSILKSALNVFLSTK